MTSGQRGGERRAQRDLRWTAAALGALLCLAVADLTINSNLVLTTTFVLPATALAVVAPPRIVAAVLALGFALAVASGFWNNYAGSGEHVLRLLIVGSAGVLAYAAARARTRAAGLAVVLEATQRRLDGMLRALAEAVTVNDERGKTVYANQAAADILGLSSPADVIRSEPGELGARFAITREDGSPVAIEDLPGRRLLRGEPAPPLLTLSVHKESGVGRWLLTKATLLVDDDGRHLAVNVIEDVTEAKVAELRQRFLAEAGRVLASTLDYEQMLERVAQLAVPWLADWCSFELPDELGALRQVALAHKDPEKVALGRELNRRWPTRMDADSGAGAIMRGGPAELFPAISDEVLAATVDDPERLAALRDIGMRAAMIVPMRVQDETLGVISFVSSDSGRTFDEDDLAFAEDLAVRAGTAVQNARLFEQQVRVSHTLQASLLPDRLPLVPGWESGAAYQAGERGTEVGGDFYDVVATPRGHVVFLGDVTGKGVAAAALTSLVRHSARMAARFDLRPAELLAMLNEVLTEQPRLAPVTIVVAQIEGDCLTVAAAGHPLPVLKDASGAVREIGRHGVLLGLPGAHVWREDQVRLVPGDALLLYTDGVTDTPGSEGRFGVERLHETVRRAPSAPHELIACVERALDEFESGGATDDRAILVLRYSGEIASIHELAAAAAGRQV